MKTLPLSILLLFISTVLFAQEENDLILRGNQFYQQRQFAEAEKYYRQALETDPKNSTAQYNLANALQMQKKYSEAADLLETLAKQTAEQPLKSASYYNQGVAHTKQKNLEASIESYKKALRIRPDDQQARENLQKALRELKQKQQQQQQQQQKSQSKMSQKEAEQKLKLLRQKEKELQERMKSKNKQQGTGGAQDW